MNGTECAINPRDNCYSKRERGASFTKFETEIIRFLYGYIKGNSELRDNFAIRVVWCRYVCLTGLFPRFKINEVSIFFFYYYVNSL